MLAMVGAFAAEFCLPDTDGTRRHLREFHEAGPTILLFISRVEQWRPRWQLWSLLRNYDGFVEHNTEIVIVCGSLLPELRIFQIRGGFPFVFLSDPKGEVAAAYGLLGWRDINRNFWPPSSPAATLLLDREGRVRFLHCSRWSPRPGARRLLKRLQALQ